VELFESHQDAFPVSNQIGNARADVGENRRSHPKCGSVSAARPPDRAPPGAGDRFVQNTDLSWAATLNAKLDFKTRAISLAFSQGAPRDEVHYLAAHVWLNGAAVTPANSN
jgi:hypothetical protein